MKPTKRAPWESTFAELARTEEPRPTVPCTLCKQPAAEGPRVPLCPVCLRRHATGIGVEIAIASFWQWLTKG